MTPEPASSERSYKKQGTAPRRADPKERQHTQTECLGKASCSQLLMPFLAERTAELQCSFIMCPGEGQRDGAVTCVWCSIHRGAVEIQRENPKLPLFHSRLCFRAAGLHPTVLSALFPSSSKYHLPGEGLEICTMKSAQLKHLQHLQPDQALLRSALSKANVDPASGTQHEAPM